MTLTNDVAVRSPVVILTSADFTLDTDGRDRSFKTMPYNGMGVIVLGGRSSCPRPTVIEIGVIALRSNCPTGAMVLVGG